MSYFEQSSETARQDSGSAPLAPEASAPATQDAVSLESRVSDWVRTRIGAENMHPRERAMRLLEEATELAQSEGVTEIQAARQIGYVFARPAGVPRKEAGGVAVCLLGWCAAHDVRMMDVATEEVERIEAKPIEEIRGSLARKADADLVVAVSDEGTGTADDQIDPAVVDAAKMVAAVQCECSVEQILGSAREAAALIEKWMPENSIMCKSLVLRILGDIQSEAQSPCLCEGLRQRAEKAEGFLGLVGFVPCDIPACNCGLWHRNPTPAELERDSLRAERDSMLRAVGRNAVNITDPVSTIKLVYRELLSLRAENERLRAQLVERCADLEQSVRLGVAHMEEAQVAKADRDSLRAELAKEEAAHANTIDQRDAAEDAADELAYSIAPIEEIGEHSNLNDPWKNAVDKLEEMQADLQAVRAELAASQERERVLREALQPFADAFNSQPYPQLVSEMEFIGVPGEYFSKAAAALEIKAALEPLTKIAGNWDGCPMKAEDVEKARIDLKRRAESAEERERGLREALTKLSAEVKGLLGLAPIAIRDAVGNTNVACVLSRLEESAAALATPEGQGR